MLIRLFHRTGVANARYSDLDNPSNSVKYARQWALDLVNKAKDERPESPYFNLEEVETEDDTKTRKRIMQIARFVEGLRAEKAKLLEQHEHDIWSRPSVRIGFYSLMTVFFSSYNPRILGLEKLAIVNFLVQLYYQ